MLDPIVRSAFVILVAQGLKALAAYAGFPIDDVLVNSLALAIVAYILHALGLELTVALVRKFAPKVVEIGLLGRDEE